MNFWTRVKTEIKKQNTTQEWIAKKIGVRQDVFSRWIQRDTLPKIDKAYSIAQLLEVSLQYLLTGQSSAADLPHRYADIVEDLEFLDDEELEHVRILTRGLAAQAKKKKKDA